MKKTFAGIVVFFIVFLSMFTVSCSTSDSTMTLNNNLIDVKETSDGSVEINWSSQINNKGIQDIDGITVVFQFLNDGTVIANDGEKVLYKAYFEMTTIKANEVVNLSRSFLISKEKLSDMGIDNVSKLDAEFVSWNIISINSVFDSNFYLLIISFAIMALILIIMLFVVFVYDLEFNGFFEWMSELWWIMPILIPILITGVSLAWALASWFYAVMVISIFLSIFLFQALAISLKLFFGWIADSFEWVGDIFGWFGDIFGSFFGWIGNLLGRNKYDEEVDYEMLTVAELKSIAGEYGLKGYSKLNKDELIKLITNSENDEEEFEDEILENPNPINKTTKAKTIKKVSNITMNDIAGLESAKAAIEEKILLPIKHKDIFEKYGKKSGGGILLYGPPGTGKTMFAEAVANEINASFFSIKSSDIKSKWYGESEGKVKELFSKARKSKISVIFFDEFEAIGRKRGTEEGGGNDDLVPEILAQIQGVGTGSSDSTLLIMAATNRPWDIDSALLRPGRFDEKIYIPLPDFEARHKMFEIKLNKIPTEDNVDIDDLCRLTEGFNGSDINEFCEKLKLELIKRSIKTNQDSKINNDDVKKVSKTIRSSVQLSDLEAFEKFDEANK